MKDINSMTRKELTQELTRHLNTATRGMGADLQKFAARIGQSEWVAKNIEELREEVNEERKFNRNIGALRPQAEAIAKLTKQTTGYRVNVVRVDGLTPGYALETQ